MSAASQFGVITKSLSGVFDFGTNPAIYFAPFI
jgi:hypothetical protein